MRCTSASRTPPIALRPGASAGRAPPPHAALSQVPLLEAGELERVLVEWNAPEAAEVPGQSVVELFEEQAARTPEAVAVVYGDQSVSYGELNCRANRLAH